MRFLLLRLCGGVLQRDVRAALAADAVAAVAAERCDRCRHLRTILNHLPRGNPCVSKSTNGAEKSGAKTSGERSKEAWSGLTSASPFQRVSNFQTLLSPQVGQPQLTASSASRQALQKAWEEDRQNMPWLERSVWHATVIGAGGIGKTYVVKNILFSATNHVFPPDQDKEPSILATAFSWGRGCRR